MAEEVRNQLYNVAGVKPSIHWIESYRRSNPSQQQASADVLLQEILYHDLRDVVRELDPCLAPPGNSSSSTAQQWRQLVQSSQQQQQQHSNSNNTESPLKATLPESFRLMIQVEEVVDVARNAETRLGGGNGGGGNSRCLKLCVSDGYYGNGSANNNNTEAEAIAMLAMEVSSIPNLTMASKAGLKILLHGPIDIRLGVLMLHEGNALVLGGHVQPLVDIQAKALQDAKRESGVGIDPTIRALIWNPDTGAEEDEDEGEQGSADVVMAQPPAPPMGPQAPSIPAFHPTVVPHRRQQQQQPAHQNAPPLGNNNLPHVQQQQQQQNIPAQRQPATVSPILPLNPLNNPSHSDSQGRGDPVSSVANSSTTSDVPQVTQARAVAAARPQGNPYARNSAAASRRSNNSASQSSSVHFQSSSSAAAAAAMPPTSGPRNVPNNETIVRDTTDSSAMVVEAPVRPQSWMEDASISTSASGSENRLSFDELKTLLARARQDQTLYRQQYGKTFVLSMKQCGSHHYFNIDKVKKRDRKKEDKKKGDKKYEYAMHAKFSGPANNSEDYISCAISSDIIEPYFGHPPAEMRRLNKSDRDKSAAHISKCGKEAKDAFLKLGLWEVTLVHSPDECFRSSIDPSSPPLLDGTQPVLMLLSRRDC